MCGCVRVGVKNFVASFVASFVGEQTADGRRQTGECHVERGKQKAEKMGVWRRSVWRDRRVRAGVRVRDGNASGPYSYTYSYTRISLMYQRHSACGTGMHRQESGYSSRGMVMRWKCSRKVAAISRCSRNNVFSSLPVGDERPAAVQLAEP